MLGIKGLTTYSMCPFNCPYSHTNKQSQKKKLVSVWTCLVWKITYKYQLSWPGVNKYLTLADHLTNQFKANSISTSLLAGPHYQHCRTHVSLPVGRFERTFGEVCLGSHHSIPHTFPQVKKHKQSSLISRVIMWQKNSNIQLIDK